MNLAEMGLPEALERAATALPDDADVIRPANGDPIRLAEELDEPAAKRVLTWLLTHEPGAGEALAADWAEDPDGAGRVVLAIESTGLSKAGRKALRRVHHRLRSQGRDLPKEAPAEVVATLPSLDETVHEARLSPLDPRGTRVLYLALDHPAGGVRLFETVVDEVHGVLGFEVYNTGRSRAKKFLRELERKGERRGAAAPPDAVRALIARAAAAHPESRALPRGFTEWRNRVAEPPEEARTPGELAREALPLEGLDPEEACGRVAQWVASGTVGPWPPDPDAATAAAKKISDAGKGSLVLSEGTRLEQVDRAFESAIGEIFDEAFSELTARRFEEAAYLLWKTAPEEDARSALAVARRFREGAPEANPVARAMLEVLFAPVLAEARSESGGADPEPVLEG